MKVRGAEGKAGDGQGTKGVEGGDGEMGGGGRGWSGLGRALTSGQTQPGQLSTAYTCIPYQYTQSDRL